MNNNGDALSPSLPLGSLLFITKLFLKTIRLLIEFLYFNFIHITYLLHIDKR